jgi:Tol biopolymer transport system component
VPRTSHWWLALVAALVVLALSGCQTGASGKHAGTSKVSPSSTAHPAAVQPASKIAFMSNRTGTYNVYVVNANGGGLRQLTRFRSGDAARPALSPDGKSVVFDRAKTAVGSFDI